ncbi:MAG: formylglycine-generating enzyme family protein [Methylococcaceae bacterium]|nr:MAG: formylglycine-generating enzyme family protein [Methylococcaceae bacterium]
MNSNAWGSALALLAALAGGAGMAKADGFTNHIGMSFVDIPAGSFFMGSCKANVTLSVENKKRIFMGLQPLGEPCPSGAEVIPEAADDEIPQHAVNIAAFQMGKTEVTLGQFKQFIAAAERTDLLSDDFIAANQQGDDAAVSYVSWEDAQQFIAWLNQSKPPEDADAYRLPSEAEWEYAARAGSNQRYHFGNDPALLGEYAWYGANAGDLGEKHTHAVAAKKPNAWGLYDMHGNVWEWISDCWHANYRNAPQDGRAWTWGCLGNFHLLRGGSWPASADAVRAAYRHSEVLPSHIVRGAGNGFRLARAFDSRQTANGKQARVNP